jgi:hypothetical protein
MRHTRRRLMAPAAAGLLATAIAVTGLASGGAALGAATASGAAAYQSAGSTGAPTIRLIVTQKNITVPRYGKRVYLDPGIWVAALRAPLRIDVARSSYTTPIRATEIMKLHGATIVRSLPSWAIAGWSGLRDFVRLQVRNVHGKVVATSKINFCPNTYDAERTGPDSTSTSIYPQACGAYDPFPLSSVWGVARGWAVDPMETGYCPGCFPGPIGGRGLKLKLGKYHVSETIPSDYGKLFGIPARDRTATVTIHVVKSSGCCGQGISHRQRPASKPLPSLPRNVPLLSHAPAGALPDLVPLPSWGITTSHVRKSHQDFLNFGATVWVGGTSPLDVEGFRTPGSPTMKAYQYYWRNGHIIGRTRAGIMFYDNEKGHHHWHFQQFAKYVLLNASKKVAVRSEKVGFCIAPSDAVDLAMPDATWQPSQIGLAGQCGTPTAMWVQEYMPIGWGDTYNQYKAGQAFNITHLPDGTYYIEIIANPEHLLHEVTRSNDVSLRKVIISGPAGHRHVRVPAWHGIDPEK